MRTRAVFHSNSLPFSPHHAIPSQRRADGPHISAPRARSGQHTRYASAFTQVKSGYAKALFLKMVISCTENIVMSNSSAQMRPPAAGGGEERDGPDLAARLILTAACARDRLLAAPRPELRSS